MAKNREAVTCNGRAAFYAAMWEDIRQCAMDNGWAVALHGSLSADMDIMAMPWVTNAVSFAELVKAIRLLFEDNHMPGVEIAYNQKPHGRIVATIPIWADFYLDISTIDPKSLRPNWISVKDRLPKNSTYVNVTTDGVVAQAYWHNGKFYAFTAIGVATVGGVTHWMPLPKPPGADMRGEKDG